MSVTSILGLRCPYRSDIAREMICEVVNPTRIPFRMGFTTWVGLATQASGRNRHGFLLRAAIVVEALAGLAAEMAGVDVALEQLYCRAREMRVLRDVVVLDVEYHVEAHQIHYLERSECGAHVDLHHPVDVGGISDAGRDHHERL